MTTEKGQTEVDSCMVSSQHKVERIIAYLLARNGRALLCNLVVLFSLVWSPLGVRIFKDVTVAKGERRKPMDGMPSPFFRKQIRYHPLPGY